MAQVVLFAVAVIIYVAVFVFSYLVPPRNFPKNIPTIPFYVSLLSLVKDVDQLDIYYKYIEKPLLQYGAVKMFFGSQWNVIVARPEFVAEIFKREDIYQKSGNHKKIPGSVLADYTGDNIISAHGPEWRLYQSLMKPGFQKNFEVEPILQNVRKLIPMLRSAQAFSIDTSGIVPQILQRYTLANLSQSMFQVDFESLDNAQAPLHQLQLAVKREVFKPIFLNFPVLDLVPFTGRMKARKLVREFLDKLCQTVQTSHKDNKGDFETDRLGSRLIAAHEMGILTDDQFRGNMGITFIAGHENPMLALTSMMYLLGKHEDVQDRLRSEIRALGSVYPSHAVLRELPYLTAVIYESLRVLPPLSQIVNRRTSQKVRLGNDIILHEGTYVGYYSYATNRSRQAWGEDADEFRPERWGSTTDDIRNRFRRANTRAEFISFHGGRRACLGQKFSMLQMRVTLFEVIKALRWSLDPTWAERMTPGGPLSPRMLRLKFEEV